MARMTGTDIFNTRIDGFKELEAALKALPREIAKSVSQETANAGAKVMRAAVLKRIPIQTGRLRALVKLKVLKPMKNDQVFTTLVTLEDGYLEPHIARWLEFGTGKLGPAGRFKRNPMIMKARTMAWKRGINLNEGTQKRKINRFRKDGTQLSRTYKQGLTKNPRGFNYAAAYSQKYGIRPRPAWRPAVHENQDAIINAMRETFQRGVIQAWGKFYTQRSF